MPPRKKNPEEKKKTQSFSIEDKKMMDIEWIAVKKYNFVNKRGRPNVSRFIRMLFLVELKKFFPDKYKHEEE